MTHIVQPIEWQNIERVLLVRLRSIGDAVLATPAIFALKAAYPHIKISVLMEDWAAPVLAGLPQIDELITVSKGFSERMAVVRRLRKQRFDVAINLHGGTTGTFFTIGSGALHTIGFAELQYAFLYKHLLSSSADLWGRTPTHSAEQQMALFGFTGVPVSADIKTHLKVDEAARAAVRAKLAGRTRPFAMIHPAAAFAEKQWAAENFAAVIDHLAGKGIDAVAVGAKADRPVLEAVAKSAAAEVDLFDDLSLPQVTALAAEARLFVGNDSGIAHIAAAVGTPVAVIFGASNPDHWSPWTNTPHKVIYSQKECSHYKGKPNEGTEKPMCIRCVEIEQVTTATDHLLAAA